MRYILFYPFSLKCYLVLNRRLTVTYSPGLHFRPLATGAKGLKWAFFNHESEHDEFGVKLKAMSWSFYFHLSAIPPHEPVHSIHSNTHLSSWIYKGNLSNLSLWLN